MKILTITCHDVYNAGASLQAYALQTYLRLRGHEAGIINYKPSYQGGGYKLFRVGNPLFKKLFFLLPLYYLLKVPGRILSLKRKRRFDSFTRKYLSLTRRYSSSEELAQNPPPADLYIAGSDQIWNPLFPNGKDPAFFLDFVSRGRKASYAASFAVDEIPPEFRPGMRNSLEKLDFISVRESSGLKVLDSLNISGGVSVADPVFLLPGEHWDSLADTSFLPDKTPYLFVYDFDGSPRIREIAVKVAAQRKLKIYTLFKAPYADRVFPYMGPEDFLGIIKNADFVISNSFHATAFSIIYEKDFLVVNRQEAINTRMRDLLQDLNLETRLSPDAVNQPVDWNTARSRLEIKTADSKAFLDRITGDLKYPLLPPDNCSGCGVCAAVCRKHAR